MRNLTQAEIDGVLDNNGESSDGAIAIEATVQELADRNTETDCGSFNNTVFKTLAKKGHGSRLCRGWFIEGPTSIEMIKGKTLVRGPMVCGMFHIEIADEETAMKVERIADTAKGSLRYEGNSLWDGFKEFEIE